MQWTLCLITSLVAASASAKENSEPWRIQRAPASAPMESSDRKSLESWKQDLKIETDATQRFYILTQIARKFVSQPATGKWLIEASRTADLLLKEAEKYRSHQLYSHAIHYPHVIKGRIKLANGDVEGAKSELKAAANLTDPSFFLKSFGPNFTLARELLLKGEKKAVLEYIDQVQKFWFQEPALKKIAEWKSDLAKGKTPDFGKMTML